MTQRRLAVLYFLVQAVAIVAWWALLVVVPSTRPYFMMRGESFTTFGAFAPGDLGIIAVGSLWIGVGAGRGWAPYTAWCVSGAMLYATSYVATAAVTCACSPLGACLMLASSVASVLASAILSRHALADSLPSRSSA